MDPVPVATLVISAANTLLTLRGGVRQQRADHVREDADRALAALAALRDEYRRLRTNVGRTAPNTHAVAALEEALTSAAVCLSGRVSAAAEAYVGVGRLYAARAEESGTDAEAGAFSDLRAAVVAERNAFR